MSFKRFRGRSRSRRWWSRADSFLARGVPIPVGRPNRPAGIWMAVALDGMEIGYLVGTGESSKEPVALVLAARPGVKLQQDRYAIAHAIANDFNRAARPSQSVCDLRKGKAAFAMVLEKLVLFPTDKRGRRVHNTNFGKLYGSMLVAGGMWTACAPDVIPWESTVKAGRLLRSSLSLMHQKENGQAASDALSPGQSESIKGAAVTAFEDDDFTLSAA